MGPFCSRWPVAGLEAGAVSTASNNFVKAMSKAASVASYEMGDLEGTKGIWTTFIRLPGNFDLFGMVIRDPLNGCWWPPTGESKGHELNHLVVDVYLW